MSTVNHLNSETSDKPALMNNFSLATSVITVLYTCYKVVVV